MAEITWKSILTKLVGGDHLSAEESEWFVDDLMNGNANPAAVGAVLATQQQLGLTPDEVRGAAKAMIDRLLFQPVRPLPRSSCAAIGPSPRRSHACSHRRTTPC